VWNFALALRAFSGREDAASMPFLVTSRHFHIKQPFDFSASSFAFV
jgi:hypothetical protein